jgi:hypothetical protein
MKKLGGSATETTLQLFPATGDLFGYLKITNGSGTEECLETRESPITTATLKAEEGPVCELIHATEEQTEHELNCRPTKSNMKIGATEADMSLRATITLSGTQLGKKWSIKRRA